VLGRPASEITLLDVHRAIDEDSDVIPIHQSANPRCPVGRHIQGALERRIDAVERAMNGELARTTIADLASDVTRRARRTHA
jgi:DNA-binding IscR family transcriptional regulator